MTRLWAQAKYFHPYLAYKPIDWDAAYVTAVPKVQAAARVDEYSRAVADMLAVLGDPASFVVPVRSAPALAPAGAPTTAASGTATPAAPAAAPSSEPVRTLADGVLLLSLRSEPEMQAAVPRIYNGTLASDLAKARAVIIDLRQSEPRGDESYLVSMLSSALVAHPLQLPAQRYLVHSGYAPQTAIPVGFYYSAFEQPAAELVKPHPESVAKRVVFVVNEHSTLPELALALQWSGDGSILAAGKVNPALFAPTTSVDLGEGVRAVLRTAELLVPEGGAPKVDLEVIPDDDDSERGAVLRAAINLAKTRGKARRLGAVAALPAAVTHKEEPHADMQYPPVGYRLLAAARLWSVIEYFYPYRDILDDDWQALLPEFLRRLEAAADAKEYALTVAELASRIADNHTTVSGSAELTRYFGNASAPVALRLVEGQPTVTDILDEAAAKGAGIAVGDVIVEVDGEAALARLQRLSKYLAGSHAAVRQARAVRRLLDGADGVAAKVRVRDARDQVRELEVPRKAAFSTIPAARHGEVYRVLPGNIGYVDLDRLQLPEVEPMLAALRDTKGIVFDMRGYPNGVAWVLAPRLNTKHARVAATFQRRRPSAIDPDERLAFAQQLPPSNGPLYEGKTVMLIDERTISQAEHTGLFFEAANGTRFVGSRSAGANGDVTSMILPGGVAIMFTGHDVRHADGRQLQRVGIVPDVEVAPTLKGLREGRDEVLERAVALLR